MVGSRLNFFVYRSGRLTREEPGPGASQQERDNYRFAAYWATRTRESFFTACWENLDDILLEIDQMMLDICDYLSLPIDQTTYPERASWANHAVTRYPHAPRVRINFADPSDYKRGISSIANLPSIIDSSGVDYSDLARFKFIGWRDLPNPEFEDLALQQMPQLFREHEALRALLCRTVSKVRDIDGYWGFDFRRVQEDLLHELIFRFPPLDEES